MRQPRVISEVIAGVILGPSVLGRIPNFSHTIFPPESLPYLTLTANIGLVLFLFLVGLETDTRVIRRNAKYSVFVAAGGMILPFSMGVGVASLVYKKFVDQEEVTFGNFLLFVGVAFAITAFPVLCRILTELKLLETTVGIVVLSAGVGNDIIAWVLLALAVSLVNASTGLTALWVLLATTAFTLFLLIPIRYGFIWLARRTGALEEGQPSTFIMTIILLLVFTSAFCTDILGSYTMLQIAAVSERTSRRASHLWGIFGWFSVRHHHSTIVPFTEFIASSIPHESGFAIALTEKLEDLVSLLFLPLYFTLSGLKTDLGLLNNGTTWAYTILITVVAFIGKFVGAATSSRWLGFNWRESGAIGVLMSCKGLVELIVLNIGLQAGILSPRVFAMFVIEALTLTFITTPLTLWIYPPKYRKAHTTEKTKPDEESRRNLATSPAAPVSGEARAVDFKRRVSVVLHRLEHISPLMTMTQLLGAPEFSNSSSSTTLTPPTDVDKSLRDPDVPSTSNQLSTPRASEALNPTVDALRLIDLSDRTSAVMYGSVTSELLRRDPLVSALRTFTRIHGIPMTSASLAVIPYEEFPSKIVERAAESGSDLLLLSWNATLHPVIEPLPATQQGGEVSTYNPFDSVFGKGSGGGVQVHASPERSTAIVYAQFIRKVFALSAVDVALCIESENVEIEQQDEEKNVVISGQRIFMPYFGGPDDRLALSLLVQMCASGGGSVQATVVRITKTEPDASPIFGEDNKEAANMLTIQSASGFPDTIYGPESTHMRLQSETADNLLWNSLVNRSSDMAPLSPDINRALQHITFRTTSTPTPLAYCIEQINQVSKEELDVGVARGTRRNIMAVAGRGRRLAVEDHHAELKEVLSGGPDGSSKARVSTDAGKTLGDVGTALIVGGPAEISLLIVQAAIRSPAVND
ncbi:K(+)/H(+) antiporter [Serendipita sp. 399]|nr:K(+)/H(+) antiporter [Serendipita sp. 399]